MATVRVDLVSQLVFGCMAGEDEGVVIVIVIVVGKV